MQNRTMGIVITAITAIMCGCGALLSCIFGGIIASGTPFDVTTSSGTSQQTFPPTIGFVLLCLSFLLIIVPVAVGFFTLRTKPELPQELPPTS